MRMGLHIKTYEADENGQPTSEVDHGFLPSRLTVPVPVPEYMCQACGQSFGSQLEAKLHPEDADTEPWGGSSLKIKN